MNRDLLKRGELNKVADSLFFLGSSKEFVMRALEDKDCEMQEFKRGERIFSPKDFRKSVGFILQGRISVHKANGEHEFNMSTLESGNYFGVAAVFSSKEEYVTILSAAKDCRVLFLRQELLQRLMQENFCVCENYIRFLTDRIHFLNHKIQDLSADSSERALAGYLLANTTESSEIILKGSFSELAERLNIGRASLYRAFDALIGNGIITKDGKKITVLRRQDLEVL